MILLVGFIAAIAFTVIAVIFMGNYGTKECIGAVSLVVALNCWIAIGVMGVIAIITNVGAKGDIAANQQLYSSLVYQLEHVLYDNDNDIGKLELYEKVTKWNTDLARGKEMQNDIWFGVFYPNIYDQFEFIELPKK